MPMTLHGALKKDWMSSASTLRASVCTKTSEGMKLRIDLSCVEQDLYGAMMEAKKILQAVDGVSCEIKVYHSINRESEKGHSWASVTHDCDVNDKIKIYELNKRIRELESGKQ